LSQQYCSATLFSNHDTQPDTSLYIHYQTTDMGNLVYRVYWQVTHCACPQKDGQAELTK